MEQKEMDKIQVVAEIHKTKEGNGTSSRPLPKSNTVPNSNPNYTNNIESHNGSGSPTNQEMNECNVNNNENERRNDEGSKSFKMLVL